MVERDWDTQAVGGGLRIRGLRGGTIGEVTGFLGDLEKAHDAIHQFGNVIAIDERVWRRFGPGRFEILGLGALYSLSASVGVPAISEQIVPELRLELRRVNLSSPDFGISLARSIRLSK